MTRLLRNILIACVLCLFACDRTKEPDAYGIVSAHGWMIASSEAGQIVSLDIREGQSVSKGSRAVQLDTSRLVLHREALKAQINATEATHPNVGRQVDVLVRQRQSLQNEKSRLEELVSSGTASSKQLDNLNDQLLVLESQISAARSSLSRESAAILAQIEALHSQLTLIDDQIRRCRIDNPEDGTVSELYSELYEFVAPGQPIYKLTDYTHPYVDAWLSGDILARVSLGDSLTVKTDGPDGRALSFRGAVSFIAGEAEFAPNEVMTRDSRTVQVWRIRIELPANPALKPGLSAEIYL